MSSTISRQLQYVDDTAMTISRKKYGRGYRYIDEDGQAILQGGLLKRIKSLVIPPMWSEVKICKWDDGHIQAIGRDLKGRKQYIYHSEWERLRQEEKFAKMDDFGNHIADIRRIAVQHVHTKGWSRDKIMALIILVLDQTGIRIGNQQYTDSNKTYGLTTLRRKHLDLGEDYLELNYMGKSNKERNVVIEDPELIQFLRQSAELPGYELFRYKENGQYQTVDSNDVNQYIHTNMGKQFSSKDFRTWVASRLAVELYPIALDLKKETPRRKLTNILLRQVADELGNTPTICRDYYVHPAVMRLIEKQELKEIDATTSKDMYDTELSASEKLLLDVIISDF